MTRASEQPGCEPLDFSYVLIDAIHTLTDVISCMMAPALAVSRIKHSLRKITVRAPKRINETQGHCAKYESIGSDKSS